MTTVNYEYFVSLEVAKLLKEAGFDWECIHYYSVNTLHEPNNGFIHIYKQYEALFYDHNRTKMSVYSAPTLDVAQRWLRENWDLIITIEYNYHENSFICKVYSKAECLSILFDFSTYEEALEAGIKKALEIILEKNM